jgi:dienelactone hydrolase
MHVPAFPMAGFLVFWGGVQNGFWAFAHNPVDYAKKISCPTLLLYGEQDKNVSRQEIDAIYNNLSGAKDFENVRACRTRKLFDKISISMDKGYSRFCNNNRLPNRGFARPIVSLQLTSFP